VINTDSGVWKIEQSDIDTNGDLAESQYTPGWYFVDETENFVGPYNSRQECLDAQVRYEP